MFEKRKGYIDQLTRDLKSLEERVAAVKNNDSLPFSFFRESFDKIQAISKTLHQLEFMQIDDMRGQMERLVYFLSEAENKKEAVSTPAPLTPKEEYPIPLAPGKEDPLPLAPERDDEAPDVNQSVREDLATASDSQFPKGIVLPEYRNPKIAEAAPGIDIPVPERKRVIVPDPTMPVSKEKKVVSWNDTIPAQSLVIDLKRGISLNDRFLFQRELFQNNRQEMDRVMQVLSTFKTYEEAEKYLRESLPWDFENSAVNDFLQVIKQGFE